jgi:hypothetical protein
MALVNPNIAMSFRGPEIQPQNMLADYAAVQQIQSGRQAQEMNALKMQEYERARTEEEGLRNYLAQSDLAKPETRAGLVRYGKTGLAYGKALTDQDTAALTQREAAFKVQKAKGDFIAQAKRDTSQNPSDANLTAFKEDLLANPLFTAPEKTQLAANVDRILAMPVAERRTFMASQGASPSELKPILTPQNLGGTARILSTPAFGGAATPVVGSEGTVTATPAQIEANKISQGQLAVSQGQLSVAQKRLNFDREKATQPVFNAQAGGFVAPPTKENPQGLFIPATKIQAAKDQSAAVKALQSAGYNVETGEDNISKLIEKSTSGGLQAGTAAALAFFGKSTEGRKAIAALEGTANQIATDLAGGKLGAGISNTDREFIVGALGDVSNPMKTAEERLSGWTAAKNRMMLTGLIPPPKTAGAAAAGVDTNNPLLK